MSTSIIPPPIVQSTYASPPRQAAQSVLVERPAPLQDRQSELEAHLQYLLDAQAEGLVKGFEGRLTDDVTSTGSTTPTARSVRSASGRRVARPAKKKPGLRSARKGLYNTMRALSLVKDDELESISTTLHKKDEQLSQISTWQRKKAGLQEAANNVDGHEDKVRVQRLREQAETVETEIRELERQLEDRKILHRKLMRQVNDVENTVQAKLASYTSSLRMLEEDVRKFLAVTPGDATAGQTANGDTGQSIWQLPPKRRTLEMAREQFTHDREVVVSQQQSTEREKNALEEGAAVWKAVVSAVTDFERRMREDMRAQAEAGHSRDEATTRLRDLLGHMNRVIQELESRLDLAKGKNWNLLIAAIGAELDALQSGKQLLQSVLGVDGHEQGGGDDLIGEQSSPTNGDSNGRSSPSSSNGNAEIDRLDQSFETARPPPRRRRASSAGHESEDDHPDPELLFSKQDIDTE